MFAEKMAEVHFGTRMSAFHPCSYGRNPPINCLGLGAELTLSECQFPKVRCRPSAALSGSSRKMIITSFSNGHWLIADCSNLQQSREACSIQRNESQSAHGSLALGLRGSWIASQSISIPSLPRPGRPPSTSITTSLRSSLIAMERISRGTRTSQLDRAASLSEATTAEDMSGCLAPSTIFRPNLASSAAASFVCIGWGRMAHLGITWMLTLSRTAWWCSHPGRPMR